MCIDRYLFSVNSFRWCLNAFAIIWLTTVGFYRLDGADTREALEFLGDYCVECHMPGNAEAGIDRDSFRTEQDIIGSGKKHIASARCG